MRCLLSFGGVASCTILVVISPDKKADSSHCSGQRLALSGTWTVQKETADCMSRERGLHAALDPSLLTSCPVTDGSGPARLVC